jgi:cation transport ATPase
MKFNTSMPTALKPYFQKELTEAENTFTKRHFQQSWRHLERAHILGQPYPIAHSFVHWKMLEFGIKTKNTKEVIGQIPRLLIGGVKSFVGNIPLGNTGGANVPPLQPMEIPEDLLIIIQTHSNNEITNQRQKISFFFFLQSLIVVALEILSIIGIHIPMPYAPFVFAAFILGIGYNVLWNGVKAIFKLQFSSINLLMTIAVIGAFYLGEYPEAAVVIVLYVLGERLEDIGIENSKSALDELVSKAPKTAFVKSQNENIPIDKIAVGTIIQVKAGEMIPLDGKIISGETMVDEAAITGEPIPKDKHTGDNLFAGTLNKNGFIEIETTKLSVDTTFSKIIRLTFEAQGNKSETQKFIQKFSKYYTPSIIAMAILVFVIPVFAMQLDFNHWLQQAITLLVIACPCALVISTPSSHLRSNRKRIGKRSISKGRKIHRSIGKHQSNCIR